MDLTIQDWGEVIGAIAVVATLIYLIVQLRQTADSVRSSVATMGSSYTTQVWQLPIDRPTCSNVATKARTIFPITSTTDTSYIKAQFFGR